MTAPMHGASAVPPQGAGHPGPGVPGRVPGPGVDGHDVGDVGVGDLIGNVTRDLSTLMRQELRLAQAELKREAVTTGRAAGALGAAGLAGWFAVLFLSVALWSGLSNVMDAGWAGLVVAVLWGLVAAGLYVTGRSTLRRVDPVPERTAETLSHVPDALRGSRGGTR